MTLDHLRPRSYQEEMILDYLRPWSYQEEMILDYLRPLELPRGNGSPLPKAPGLSLHDGPGLPQVQESTQTSGHPVPQEANVGPRDPPQVLQASDGLLRQGQGITSSSSAQVISGDAGIENVSGNQASEPRGNLQSHLPQGGPQIYGPGNVPGGPHGEFKSNLSGESKSEGDNAGSTAQQWLGGPTTPDPMTLIAGGVAQLQAVMLKQMSADSEKVKSGGSSPEAVKPGTPVLPLLPALSAQTSSVDVMDWLEMITTPMQDLSDGSSEWWSKVMKTANDFYNKWTLSSPVDKLTIHPVKDEELEAGKWSRVNSRAASMVMLALHEWRWSKDGQRVLLWESFSASSRSTNLEASGRR